MQSVNITVKNPAGLHTRPVIDLTKLAQAFKTDTFIKKGNKQANVKSPIKVLKLGICCGDEITITGSGSDETQAVQVLVNYIENLEE